MASDPLYVVLVAGEVGAAGAVEGFELSVDVDVEVGAGVAVSVFASVGEEGGVTDAVELRLSFL